MRCSFLGEYAVVVTKPKGDSKGRLRRGYRMFYLLLAIVAEVTGTTFVKLSAGFTRLVPSVLIFVFYGLSLGFLGLALKRVDLGLAYALWSGLGIALIASVGVLWFREPVTAMKIVSMGLIVAGVAGLNVADKAH
jgi:small multidrug resistance pump